MITNKTVLITGAANGIGKELAILFAKDGYHLVLVDINETGLQTLQNSLAEQYEKVKILLITADLTIKNTSANIFQTVTDNSISVDVLINNAGFGTYGDFIETSWEKEYGMIQLHMNALTHLTKLFLPDMVKKGWGRIMNVASLAAFQPSPLMAVYFASKAYVLSFSEAIANELEGTGVKVTVLCPGATNTGFQKIVGVGNPELAKKSWVYASAEEVANYGYRALMKGETVAIPGSINKLLAILPRFFPRNLVTHLTRKTQERNRRFLKK
ncbi:MAG: SDR family oxidoreductase [Bacteroidetes bacterium]|nr:SDR family oxidoreductase [Bacteroidota bacterium]